MLTFVYQIFQYIVGDHRYSQHDLLRQPVSQPLQMPPPPQEPPLNPERAILIQRVPHRQRKGGKGKNFHAFKFLYVTLKQFL